MLAHLMFIHLMLNETLAWKGKLMLLDYYRNAEFDGRANYRDGYTDS